MVKRRTAAELIAYHVGWDMAEMSEYRYQSTRFVSPAIYTVADSYYAAPTAANVSRLRKGYAGLKWQCVGQEYGREIWEGVSDMG